MNRFIKTQSLLLLLGFLALSLGISSDAWAAGTPAGTVITNQATGTYQDANGNVIAGGASSNIVSTTVTQVADVVVTPATNTENVANGGTAYHASQILNQGNGTDTLTVAYGDSAQNGAGTWTSQLIHDVDRDGVFTSGVDTVLSTNGTYTIETLEADSTFFVLVCLTTPAQGTDGDDLITKLTATSDFDNNASDSGAYTTNINAAALTGNKTNSDAAPAEGDIVTYAVTVANAGTDTAYNVVVLDTIPSNTTYETDSNGAGLGSIRRFDGGVGTYATATNQTDASDSPTDELSITGGIVTGTLGKVAPGDTVTIYFSVTIDQEVPEGTVITNNATISFENGAGDPQPDVVAGPSTSTVEETNSVALDAVDDPDGNADDAPDSLDYSADPGDTTYYELTVTNTGNGTDSFELSSVSSLAGTAVQFFVDADSNNVPDNGTAITNTGNLGQNGVFRFVACVVLPAGATDGAVDETVVTATSDDDGSQTDTAKLKTTVTAPFLTLQKYVNTTFNQNPSVSDTTSSAAPGDTLYYTIVVSNAGTGSATSVIITDNGTGQGNTTYQTDSVTIQNGNPASGTGTAKTDADAGGDDEVIVNSGTITASLGTLGTGAVRTIRFKVVIN